MSNRYGDYDRHREERNRFERNRDWNQPWRRFGSSGYESSSNEERDFNSDSERDRYRDRSYGRTNDRSYERGYSPDYGMDREPNYDRYESDRLSANRNPNEGFEDYRRRRTMRGYNQGASMRSYGGNYRPNFEVADDAYGSYDTLLRDRSQARPYGYGYGSDGQEYSPEPSRYSNTSSEERSWWDKVSDELASWFGDENAEHRRQMDEAKGTHRGKGPRGYKRSDERILEDVNERLTDYPYVDASDIEVTVLQSAVTLTGSVDSRWAKRAAEEVVETVSGVEDVNNELLVIRTPDLKEQAESLSSAETTASIKARTKTAGV